MCNEKYYGKFLTTTNVCYPCHTISMDASSGLGIESRHSLYKLLRFYRSIITMGGDDNCCLSQRWPIGVLIPAQELYLYINIYNIKVGRGVETSLKFNLMDWHWREANIWHKLSICYSNNICEYTEDKTSSDPLDNRSIWSVWTTPILRPHYV